MKNQIKDFLMDLALRTNDCEWAAEIYEKDFDMSKRYYSTEGLLDEEAKTWSSIIGEIERGD